MSPPSYHGRQSDDDRQRHNANRHHREGRGQDRTGAIYTGKNGSDGRYCYLKSLGNYGPLDGQWVNVKNLVQAGTTSGGEKIWRSK